jgi:hypothetical protein
MFEVRRPAAHLLHPQRVSGHHLLPAHIVRAVHRVPLALLAQSQLEPGLFWIGGDLGYTNDPTELVVFHEMEIGERSLLKMILRLHLEHVAYR